MSASPVLLMDRWSRFSKSDVAGDPRWRLGRRARLFLRLLLQHLSNSYENSRPTIEHLPRICTELWQSIVLPTTLLSQYTYPRKTALGLPGLYR